MAPGDVDREIEDALGRVCELLGLDVAVLWQWSARLGRRDQARPTPTRPARIRGAFEPLHQESYPWVVEQMRAGRMVVLSVAGRPAPGGRPGRESARLTGIRSNLTLPLAVGGEAPVGALAFNTLRSERDWPDVLVKRLQLVAQVFANALARRRADLALRESEELNRATFEQAAVGIAHVGLDGRWLRVNDRLCAIVGYSARGAPAARPSRTSRTPTTWRRTWSSSGRSSRASGRRTRWRRGTSAETARRCGST